MGGDAGDMLKQTAGYAVGGLSALASLRGGGLQNYMLARSHMLADPDTRATLIDSPFTRGFYGIGTADAPPGAVAQPADGTPAAATIVAPQDARYLPAGGHSYPAIAPLAYNQQVKAEQDRSTMIGLTSNDPAIRTQSKLAIGVPLSNDERDQAIGAGRRLVGLAGPGSEVQYKLPGGQITVGSPYIAGNYLSPEAAADVARKTGGVVAASTVPGESQVVQPQRPEPGEYMSKGEADAAKTKPNQQSVPTGRTVNGQPSWYLKDQPPAGVTPLEERPTEKPAAKPTPPPPPPPAAAPSSHAVPPPPPPPPAAHAAPPPPPPPPSSDAAPPPPAPAAPQPPPPPPHEVLRRNPDGSFTPVKPVPAVPAAPRAEATPADAPPLLAAAAPSLFAFPGQRTPAAAARVAPPVMVASAAGPPPAMVASAAPPPYQLVPGSELSGVASGAPPAPAEERAAPPPPVPPAPTARVPWQEETPGQAAQAGVAPAPSGMPAGTQEFSESRPLPGDQGGSVTYGGKTAAGLDFERQRSEMQLEIERKYGKIPEAKDLAGMSVVRGAINDLLTAYTPEQRAAYQGIVEPYLKRFWSLNDPRYNNFLQMNAQIKDAALAAGIPEKALDNFPTGMERSAADYESRLRGSTNMIDKMMASPGVFQSMHPADLTPAKLQSVTDQYLSGPAPVHFGAYPWDEKTGEVIPTQTTTTSAPPTTTTSPFLVDKRYTVAPPR